VIWRDGRTIRCGLDGYVRLPGQDFRQKALVIRSEMLHQQKGHARLGRELR
jgi:hypothetical protein